MEFADLAIVSLLCDFRYDRTYHTAGTTPVNIEIEKNGFLGIQNFVCEIFFTNFITDISVSPFCFYYIRFEIRFCDIRKIIMKRYRTMPFWLFLA